MEPEASGYVNPAERRHEMGRTVGISIGGLILLLIVVAVLF
jgi:hypothetical protein